MGDVTIRGCVLRTVGIEQIHRHTTHLRFPQSCNNIASGDPDRDLHPFAVGLQCRLYRQIAWIALPILRMLVAVAVDALREVTLLVEETHSDEVCTGIACGLAVVTRQYTQAARIDLEAFVEAVFRAEVGDERGIGGRRRGGREIGVLREQYLVVAGQVHRILGHLIQLFLGDAAQHEPGIAAGLFPQLAVEIFEQGARGPGAS
jgi:hypothetical protein